jgi:hypothetical protein
MSLTKEKIISDYNYFKNKAILYCQKGDIDKSVKFAEMAARIGYKFSFIYTDEELEDNIKKIGEKILCNKINYIGIENRIVFYDSFAIDNRNLTLQYLKAIFKWDSELLYITNKKTVGRNILGELKEYPKSTILFVEGDSFIERIKRTAETIAIFKPEKVFLHYLPWDIFGFTLWSQVKSAERFFINLTDHAYWLGKSTADYFLEFRKYGCSISIKYRNIPINRLLIQHYYPIVTNKRFEGFPFEKENKILAFSGSNYYKIYGKDFLFLMLIKEVLSQNKNLVFLFAGNGDSKPLLKFIKKHKMGDRFILIGNRSDLSEVFKHIDIYVNTFPMIGGLMSQYAAINGKPIIGYSDSVNYSFNDTEDFLGIERKGLIVKSSIKEFLEYFNILVNDKGTREKNIAHTRNAVISENDFGEMLKQNITHKSNSVNLEDSNITICNDNVFDIFYDMEVNYLKEYYYLIFYILRTDLFKCKLNLIILTVLGTLMKKMKFY